MSTEPKRDETRLEEVAKLTAKSETRRESKEAKEENSGMIDLAAIAASSARPVAAPEDPSEDTPGSGRPATASMVRPKPAKVAARAQPAPGASTAQAEGSSAVGGKARSHVGWGMLSTGIVVGAVVAGVFFHMGKADRVQGSTAVVVPRSAANVPATARGKDDKAPAAAPPETHGIDPSALPRAPAIEPVAAHPPAAPAARTANAPAGPGAAPAVAQAPAPPAARAGSTKWTPTSSPAPAPGSDQSLEALMKRAVGNTAAPAPPPAAAAAEAPKAGGDGLPAKPAMGAVQGAVGTVLPAARYCLGPDDPVSRATITFKSDGTVENVSVSGDAAGQPAEECIRSRLMAARVSPFGSPTFTWTVTVRPAS
jgi:hypothetical protein